MSSSIKEASRDMFTAHHKTYHFFSLALAAEHLGPVEKLPKSMKVLLENLLLHQDDVIVTEAHLRDVAGWLKTAHAEGEIAYRPARVLMQDFTGVPAVVDLAAYGNEDAYAENNHLEMSRNRERYTFLRWGQNAFSRFRVVPPENGICHQVNLNTLPRPSGTKSRADNKSPIRIRWSAPTPTPRWSTDWGYWAGASAG